MNGDDPSAATESSGDGGPDGPERSGSTEDQGSGDKTERPAAREGSARREGRQASADDERGERGWTLDDTPPGRRERRTRTAGTGTPAASAGVVAAFLALLATVPVPPGDGGLATLGWWPGASLVAVDLLGSPLGAALAFVALGGFLWRRTGLLGGRPVAVVSGVTSLALVAVTAYRLVEPATGGGSATAGYRLPVAMLAGLTGVGLAVATARGVDRATLRTMGRRVAAAVGITVGAFLVLIATAITIGGLPRMVEPGASRLVAELVVGPLAEVAFVGVAVAYVLGTDRDWSFLDFRWPSLLEVGIAVGGTIALLVMQFVVIGVIRLLELPSSSQSTLEGAAREAGRLGQPELVLVLVPMMLFVVAPAEELLFRNVVQKSLYGAFSRRMAVLVAGIVFALAHILAYFSANHAALFVSLASIFVISLVLGFLYEVTENLTVTTVAHGLYNSLLVVLLYVALVAQQMQEGTGAWVALVF